MKCDLCGATNAHYILKENINGHVKVSHICEVCMTSKAKSSFFESYPMPFSNLFSTHVINQKASNITCPKCHHSLMALEKTGRFGCAECYETFSEFLLPYINRIQSGSNHVGKKLTVARQTPPKETLSILKKALEEAISEERYEDAIVYRDKIKTIEEAKNEKA